MPTLDELIDQLDRAEAMPVNMTTTEIVARLKQQIAAARRNAS